jgi:dipeptidyl aminopeptidase/acylaminoacyl peptidase
MKSKTFIVFILLNLVIHFAGAVEKYQRPSKKILEILDAPALPSPIVSPTGKAVLLATWILYPPISDFAEPQLRLAGVRINPRNNALHGGSYYTKFSILKVADGSEIPVPLPPGARALSPQWNSDGSMFAFSNMTETSVELWIAEVATGKIRRMDDVRLNPVLGSTITWMPDQKNLLVKAVPQKRTEAPADKNVPAGPIVEETGSVTVASSTYESRDLLKTPHDADLFEYYATSQLTKVDTSNGAVTVLGDADVFSSVEPSPDGKYVLVERVRRPYSFTRAYYRFPTDVEVWDGNGRKIETLAKLPLAEQVPIGGVRTGQRSHSWCPTAPATLIWVEALDEGDSYKKVPHHDRILTKSIGGKTAELFKTEQRFSGLDWIENGKLAFVTDYDDDKHWTKTFLLDTENRSAAPRLVWSLNSDDYYHNPGTPVYRILPNGSYVVGESEGAVFMQGEGASPDGNRPFLDRLDLRSLKTQRIFRSDRDHLEYFLEWVDPAAKTFLTQRESRAEPPNLYLHSAPAAIDSAIAEGEASFRSTIQQLTHFKDPTPQLRQISKRLITYKRPDGVDLSFTLYLPPGYKEGTRLPTVLWAYPLDYTDPAAAGQVVATPQQFTSLYGSSPVFLTLEGYAVLDDAAMPVVGPTETAYDTFIDQIVANAKAAIDKAVELGVTDPERVAVMGHSHGALMTANLLAWSDLFRAGVARSGAYNHTLRPFGFQNERRTLYKATETYFKLSPLLHADRINEPLLLIHGERDANPGTVPLQSEKLYEAIRGVGGTARWVVLPLESHSYTARESIDQVLYEMVTWCDRYVKNAKPRAKQAASP